VRLARLDTPYAYTGGPARNNRNSFPWRPRFGRLQWSHRSMLPAPDGDSAAEGTPMRDADDPRLGPAASSVWQIVAVVALLAVAGLLVLSIGLGAALLAVRYPPHPANGGPGAADAAAEEDDNQEPANPPYPVKQDLRDAGPATVPGEKPAPPAPTARDRFLALGREAWAAQGAALIQDVRTAPDGQHVAYVEGQTLFVQPLGATGAARPVGEAVSILGRPAWSGDGRFVYFADREGGLRRYDVQTQGLDTLPFHGEAPVPAPDGRQLVFRRTRPTPKVDLPDGQAAADPREIVLGDLETHKVRVLVKEDGPDLTPLAVSPDSKRLALVAVTAAQPKQPEVARLLLLDLAPGAESHRVGPPSATLESVCWSGDGKALFYSRAQQPLPPDCWEADTAGPWAALDLFRLDVGTRKETRLSRGGGFGPPAVTADGNLFFLVWKNAGEEAAVRLHRAPLAAVLDFAAHEPNPPARDLEAWAKMLDDALDRARVPAQATGDALPPEVIERLAASFARSYKEHFKAGPPVGLRAWERVQHEVRALAVPEADRPRFVLVLGAVQGEYLCKKHGASWYMGAGPLIPPEMPSDRPDEANPFGLILNPFRASRANLAGPTGDDDEDSGPPVGWLRDALVRARGRTLLLTNDPAATKDALHELADPDLSRAAHLLEMKKGDEADQLLLDLVKRPQHAKNEFLALYVGKLLIENGRLAAARLLLEPRADAPPREAPKYNLLGLALLDSDPPAAAVQFRNALRCDLAYGPGWLNLAQAYAQAGDRTAAELCLRHYLRVLPFGPFADDARQRLAALHEGQ
jgi:hypothetical protein